MSETNTTTNEPMGRFFYQAVIDKVATREAGNGLRHFKNELWIEVTKPGDRTYVKNGPASEDHKKLFARSLESFLERGETPIEGTPLAEIPIFGVDQIATLKSAGVKTFEKFMSLSENDQKAFGPTYQKLHKQGSAYLEAANSKGALASKFSRSQDANDALMADVEGYKKLILELKEENNKLRLAAGRPPAELATPTAADHETARENIHSFDDPDIQTTEPSED